jgi:hypothetical protein
MEVQTKSPNMTGTELNAVDDRIPKFKEAVKRMNMMDRHAGLTDGFVCKSSAGRVVRLIQNYDSDVFTAEPEDLPAQYGFVWSNDPAKAKAFIALSTSPYMKGNCCTENEETYRSKVDNNVHAPSAWSDGWEKVEE